MAVIAPFLQRQLYDEAVNEMADELRLKANILDSSDSDTVEDTSGGGNRQLWSGQQGPDGEQQVVVPRRNVEALRRRKRPGAPSGSEKVSNWLAGPTDWSRQFQQSYTTGGGAARLLKQRIAAGGGLVAAFSPAPLRHVVSRDFGSWWLRFNLHGKMESAFPVMSPHTRAKTSWDLFIMALVLYNAVTVPLAFSFGMPRVLVLYVWEWTMTVLYLVDMAVSFRTGHHDDDGNMVRDSWPVARYYLRTWFIVDFLATVPFDAIGQAVGLGANRPQLMILAFLRTPRLLRLIKLGRLLDRIRNANLIRLMQLVLLMMMIAHWLACIWYSLARYAPEQEGWGFDTLNDNNKYTWYLSAFYSSFLLLVGDNAVAHNDYERVFFILSLMVGACFYSAVVGNMALLVANMNSVAMRYRQRLDMTQDALRYMRVPEAHMDRVQAFYDFITAYSHPSVEGLSFLSELTKGINEDLHMFLHKEPLKRIYLFKDCESAFIRSLGMRMKIVTFIPKEIIFRQGDLGHEMYIIRAGCVAVVSKTQEFMSLLKAGDFFGEIALLTQARRTAECIALTNCDLAVLNSIELKILMKEFPDSANRLQAAARDRLRQLQIAGRAGGRLEHECEEEDEDVRRERQELRRERMKAIARYSTDRSPSIVQQSKDQQQAALVRQLEELRTQAAFQQRREQFMRHEAASFRSSAGSSCCRGPAGGIGEPGQGDDSEVVTAETLDGARIDKQSSRDSSSGSSHASRRGCPGTQGSAHASVGHRRRSSMSGLGATVVAQPVHPRPCRPASAPRQISVSALRAPQAAPAIAPVALPAPNASTPHADSGWHADVVMRPPSPIASEELDGPTGRGCVSMAGELTQALPKRSYSHMPGSPLAALHRSQAARSPDRAQKFLRSLPGDEGGGLVGSPAGGGGASLPPFAAGADAEPAAQFDAVQHFHSRGSSLGRPHRRSGEHQEEYASSKDVAEASQGAWQASSAAPKREPGPVSEGLEPRALSATNQATAMYMRARPSAGLLPRSAAPGGVSSSGEGAAAPLLPPAGSGELLRGAVKAASRASGTAEELVIDGNAMRESFEATAAALREMQPQRQASLSSSRKSSITGYAARPSVLAHTASAHTARERRRSMLGPSPVPANGPINLLAEFDPAAALQPPYIAEPGRISPPAAPGSGGAAAGGGGGGAAQDGGRPATPSEGGDSDCSMSPPAKVVPQQDAATSFAAALAATAASVAARGVSVRPGAALRVAAHNPAVHHPGVSTDGTAPGPLAWPMSLHHHGGPAHPTAAGLFGMRLMDGANGKVPEGSSHPADAHMRPAAARRAEASNHSDGSHTLHGATDATAGGQAYGGHARPDGTVLNWLRHSHKEDDSARGSLLPVAHNFFTALVGGGKSPLKRFATTEMSGAESSNLSATDSTRALAGRSGSVCVPHYVPPDFLDTVNSGGAAGRFTGGGGGSGAPGGGDTTEPWSAQPWRSRALPTPGEASAHGHGHTAEPPPAEGLVPGSAARRHEGAPSRASNEEQWHGEHEAAPPPDWVRVSKYRTATRQGRQHWHHSNSSGLPSSMMLQPGSPHAHGAAVTVAGGVAGGAGLARHGSAHGFAALQPALHQGHQGAAQTGHAVDALRPEAELHRREAELLQRETELERREAEAARWQAEAGRWQAEAAQHAADAARCRAELARCQQELGAQLRLKRAVHDTVLGLAEAVLELTEKVEELEGRLEAADATAARIEGQHGHGRADFLGLGEEGHLPLDGGGDTPAAGSGSDRTVSGERATAGGERQTSSIVPLARRTSLLHYNAAGSTSRRFTDLQRLQIDRGVSSRLFESPVGSPIDHLDSGDRLTSGGGGGGGGGDRQTPRNATFASRRLSLFVNSHRQSTNGNGNGNNSGTSARRVAERRLSMRATQADRGYGGRVQELNAGAAGAQLDTATTPARQGGGKRSSVGGDRQPQSPVGIVARRLSLFLGSYQKRGAERGASGQTLLEGVVVGERSFGFSGRGTSNGDPDSRSNSLAIARSKRRWSVVKETPTAAAVVTTVSRSAASITVAQLGNAAKQSTHAPGAVPAALRVSKATAVQQEHEEPKGTGTVQGAESGSTMPGWSASLGQRSPQRPRLAPAAEARAGVAGEQQGRAAVVCSEIEEG